MNKFLVMTLFMMTLFSCARMSQSGPKEVLAKHEDQFNYTDKNGQYSVKIESGIDKTGKNFLTKRVMELPNRQKDKALEQSIVLSSIGSLKKSKMTILRPKVSQYNVWFDGKKYTSILKINTAKKAIDVKMTSPESQWNGTKQIKFPSSTTLPCFFSQVVECARISGFINKASNKKKGAMNLMIIWEGYPFLNETFSDFPTELFSEAQLEYDGKTKQGERRFSLRVAGQSIFYVLSDQDIMTKMFWVSQGITMVSKSSKNAEPDEAGDFE
jgi:hypothetical protein